MSEEISDERIRNALMHKRLMYGINYTELTRHILKRDDEYRAIQSRQPQPQWQPIESAPKDGTKILLYCPNHDGVRTGSWDDDIGVNEENCTHWQPLPKPPTKKETT